MRLVAAVKLLVSAQDKARILATMEQVNKACAWLAQQAFAKKCADKFRLQRDHYRELRSLFGLPAQHAVLTPAKVCEAYKRDKRILPKFKRYGAITFDPRIYSFKDGLDRVSLACLNGRVVVPTGIGSHFKSRLEGARGQADLVYKKGKLYLHVTVDVPEDAPIDPEGWLGVDLGIRNLATDSDGESFSGAHVEAVRQRYAGHRQRLQMAGTRSACKRLKKIAGREARFRSIENHRISKALVAKSKGTGRGLALENLHGIRDRVTVRKAQRAQHAGWAFHQLRTFITYKARLAGVEVRIVDPRNTSRTCLDCGHCDKQNRKSQSEFRCVLCGFEAHADLVGATNISRRAAVNQPIVPSILRETVSNRMPRLA